MQVCIEDNVGCEAVEDVTCLAAGGYISRLDEHRRDHYITERLDLLCCMRVSQGKNSSE